MSTDLTRGPKVCPSCGKENPPTAARCWLCFTPLGGAFQTTTAPAPGEARLSTPPRTLPTTDTSYFFGGCVVILLVIISAVVTFCMVCAAALRGPMR